MKYIVMECHEGYAVLMDEESRFVNAANLHYEVGQTVTEPVLMISSNKSSPHISFIVTRIAAAAACIVLFSAVGINYYSTNFKTASTVLISSETGIKMGLNKKGKVICLTSNTDCGKQILKEYNGKGKDKLTVANEILEIEISKGIIDSDDTVELYISTDDSDEYSNYKSDFENGISDIKVNVQDYDNYKKTDTSIPTNAPVIKKPDVPAEPVKPDSKIKPVPKHEVAPPVPASPNEAEPKKPDEILKPTPEDVPALPAAPDNNEIAPPIPQEPEKPVPEMDNNADVPPLPDENAEIAPPCEPPKLPPPVRPAPPPIEKPLLFSEDTPIEEQPQANLMISDDKPSTEQPIIKPDESDIPLVEPELINHHIIN